MRVLIPVSEGFGLCEEIFEYFSKAPKYVVLDITDSKIDSIEVVENVFISEGDEFKVSDMIHSLNINAVRSIVR